MENIHNPTVSFHPVWTILHSKTDNANTWVVVVYHAIIFFFERPLSCHHGSPNSRAFQCTLHSKTRRSLPLFPSYRGSPVSHSPVDKERCSILCYQHLVLSDCYCSVFLLLGSAWRESGKWLGAHSHRNSVRALLWEQATSLPRILFSKRTGEALAGAPAQTAKVPTPFLFWEKKLGTGYRTMMKRFQEHHFSGENHLSALSHIDFALLLLSA